MINICICQKKIFFDIFKAVQWERISIYTQYNFPILKVVLRPEAELYKCNWNMTFELM